MQEKMIITIDNTQVMKTIGINMLMILAMSKLAEVKRDKEELEAIDQTIDHMTLISILKNKIITTENPLEKILEGMILLIMMKAKM